jgi:hypothetical protein
MIALTSLPAQPHDLDFRNQKKLRNLRNPVYEILTSYDLRYEAGKVFYILLGSIE